VPAEASAGPSEVHWSLAGPELAEAKADVTIAWCLDHKRSWCERTAASAWSEDDFAIRLSRDEALVLSDWPKLFALTTVALGSWCFSRVVGPAGVLRAEELSIPSNRGGFGYAAAASRAVAVNRS
jgi:hypothetical protein